MKKWLIILLFILAGKGWAQDRVYLDTNYAMMHHDTTSYETKKRVGPYFIAQYLKVSRDTASELFDLLEEEARQRVDHELFGDLYYSLGKQRSLDPATRYDLLNNSVEHAKAAKDTLRIFESYNLLSDLFFRLTDTVNMEKYVSEWEALMLEHDQKSYLMKHYHAVGHQYYNLRWLDKALDYHLKGYEIFLETGDSSRYPHLMVWLGNDYRDLEMYDSSEFFFDKYKEWGLANKQYGSLGEHYRYRSYIHANQGDYKTANAMLDTSFDYFVIHGAHDRTGLMKTIKASNQAKMGDYQGAAKTLDFYYANLDEKNPTSLAMYADQVAAKVYAEVGRHKDAHRWLARLDELKDSLNELQLEAKMQEHLQSQSMEALKERSQRDLELAELEKEKKDLEAKSAQRNQKVITTASIIGILGLLIVIILIVRNLRQKKKSNEEISRQKEAVEAAHEEIQDSIAYAKRIQLAILPSPKLWREAQLESFVMYKPKDVVAGDFYWMESKDDKTFIAAADCTGHGVPGAMVSVICNNGLNRSVNEFGLREPGRILDKTRELVIKEFEKSEEEVKDGMDIALVSLCLSSSSSSSSILKYSGAHNALWIIRNGASEIEETKADKQPIGRYADEKPFTTHTIELSKGDSFYIFSDGYADQFGGEKGKKFKTANLKKLLLSIKDKSMIDQQTDLEQNFEVWKGELEQVDDVCVIGVRV